MTDKTFYVKYEGKSEFGIQLINNFMNFTTAQNSMPHPEVLINHLTMASVIKRKQQE